MTSTLSTRPSRSADRPRHRHLAERPASTVRRVSIVDRAALRLGLLLITWGRRADHLSRGQLTARHELAVARARRELRAERMLLLSTPRL